MEFVRPEIKLGDMTTDKIDELVTEICAAPYDWEALRLSPEETFVITQALTHGPLSHNASTKKCLEMALHKAKSHHGKTYGF